MSTRQSESRPEQSPKAKKSSSAGRAYHHGNLRQALIETSLELIIENGVRALTLREIGNRLHVSRMAPYRHFKDKAALLAEIASNGFRKFTEALETAIRSAGSFDEQLDALAVAYVRFALENGAHFEVMFGGGGEPQCLDAAGKEIAYGSFLVLENLVSFGQRQGLVVPGNTTSIAQMIWAMVHGISVLKLGVKSASERWNPEFTLHCSKLLRAGIAPRN